MDLSWWDLEVLVDVFLNKRFPSVYNVYDKMLANQIFQSGTWHKHQSDFYFNFSLSKRA